MILAVFGYEYSRKASRKMGEKFFREYLDIKKGPLQVSKSYPVSMKS